MSKIKLLQSNNIYDCEIKNIKSEVFKITINSDTEIDFIEFSSGFLLLNEFNGLVMGEHRDYTIQYKTSDEKNVFYISNGEIYSEIEEPTKEPEKELTEEEKLELQKVQFENAKIAKINEMEISCKQAIETGVSIDDKQYSYTVQDQSNMLNAMNLAKETGLEVPYHADGESCTLYDYSTISTIYMQEQMNLTKNQTYFNQLKLYINSLDNISYLDTVNSIYYGIELTGEYLETFNSIIAQSQQIMETLVELAATE